MAIDTFNVTFETIQQNVQGLSIDPKSTPNPTTVEEMILSASAEVNAVASAKGVANWAENDATYLILRKMVIFLTASEIIAARDRGEDRATFYRTRYKDMMATLQTKPQEVQPGGETTQRGKGLVVDRELIHVDKLGLARRVLY